MAIKVLYLSPELQHPGSVRQGELLKAAGYAVTVAGFLRPNRFSAEQPPRSEDTLHLGEIRHLAYVGRLWRLIRALVLLSLKGGVRKQRYIYATNLDLALLALFAKGLLRSRAKLIYQVQDVRAVMQGPGTFGRALRQVERLVLRSCSLLVVSSPGFVANYFHPIQGYRGRWALLENKLGKSLSLGARPDVYDVSTRIAVKPSATLAIGWFGTIRCPISLRVLCEVAERLGDKVNIIIAGTTRAIGDEVFKEAISSHSNITFIGGYNSPADLGRLYNQIDFVWCVDLSTSDSLDRNPRWLLPNRLYEGGYFSVPALAASGTQCGEKVSKDSLGWVFRSPIATEVIEFLSNVNMDCYSSVALGLARRPKRDFWDDGEDFRILLSNAD